MLSICGQSIGIIRNVIVVGRLAAAIIPRLISESLVLVEFTATGSNIEELRRIGKKKKVKISPCFSALLEKGETLIKCGKTEQTPSLAYLTRKRGYRLHDWRWRFFQNRFPSRRNSYI
jgi:hypothetical protein